MIWHNIQWKIYLQIHVSARKYLKEAAVDDLVKFVIFTGTGEYFTSGADLANKSSFLSETFDRGNQTIFR